MRDLTEQIVYIVCVDEVSYQGQVTRHDEDSLELDLYDDQGYVEGTGIFFFHSIKYIFTDHVELTRLHLLIKDKENKNSD